MSRNILYVVVAALVVVLAVFAYEIQERQKTSGIEINVGKAAFLLRKNSSAMRERAPHGSRVVHIIPIKSFEVRMQRGSTVL
jgi:hypothetical protein